MSNKKIMIIFTCLFCSGVLGCTLGAIVGFVYKERSFGGTEWGFGSVLFIASFVVLMLGSIILLLVLRLILHIKGNKLILKEYGTLQSKTKSYYYYISTILLIPELSPKQRFITNFKFSSEGLYYNDNKEIFLWKNVERISMNSGGIKIEAKTRDGTKFSVGFRHDEVWLKLVKTFYVKEILERADNAFYEHGFEEGIEK